MYLKERRIPYYNLFSRDLSSFIFVKPIRPLIQRIPAGLSSTVACLDITPIFLLALADSNTRQGDCKQSTPIPVSKTTSIRSVYKFSNDVVFPLIDSFLDDSFLGQSTQPFIPSGASQPMGIFRS